MNQEPMTERKKIIMFLLYLAMIIVPDLVATIWSFETQTRLIIRTLRDLLLLSCFGYLILPGLLKKSSKNIRKVILVLSGLIFIMTALNIFISYNQLFLVSVVVLLLIVILAGNTSVQAFFARLRGATGHDSQRS
jgi:hypothetical protein